MPAERFSGGRSGYLVDASGESWAEFLAGLADPVEASAEGVLELGGTWRRAMVSNTLRDRVLCEDVPAHREALGRLRSAGRLSVRPHPEGGRRWLVEPSLGVLRDVVDAALEAHGSAACRGFHCADRGGGLASRAEHNHGHGLVGGHEAEIEGLVSTLRASGFVRVDWVDAGDEEAVAAYCAKVAGYASSMGSGQLPGHHWQLRSIWDYGPGGVTRW